VSGGGILQVREGEGRKARNSRRTLMDENKNWFGKKRSWGGKGRVFSEGLRNCVGHGEKLGFVRSKERGKGKCFAGLLV